MLEVEGGLAGGYFAAVEGPSMGLETRLEMPIWEEMEERVHADGEAG